MLTLRRRHNQGFWVGKSYVKILGFDENGNVKVGIESNLPILRGELLATDAEKNAFFAQVDAALENERKACNNG